MTEFAEALERARQTIAATWEEPHKPLHTFRVNGEKAA